MAKTPSLRSIFVSIYAVFFAVYLFIGLQPAEATSYEILTTMEIPSISLVSDVTQSIVSNHQLSVPDTIVGSFTRGYKTLLLGHSSSVFTDLHQVQIGEKIVYDEDEYIITQIEIYHKSAIDMEDLLAPDEKSDNSTLILMTCAGRDLGAGDSTHRLIVTAERSNNEEKN